jgi:hypothetical protein
MSERWTHQCCSVDKMSRYIEFWKSMEHPKAWEELTTDERARVMAEADRQFARPPEDVAAEEVERQTIIKMMEDELR